MEQNNHIKMQKFYDLKSITFQEYSWDKILGESNYIIIYKLSDLISVTFQ